MWLDVKVEITDYSLFLDATAFRLNLVHKWQISASAFGLKILSTLIMNITFIYVFVEGYKL